MARIAWIAFHTAAVLALTAALGTVPSSAADDAALRLEVSYAAAPKGGVTIEAKITHKGPIELTYGLLFPRPLLEQGAPFQIGMVLSAPSGASPIPPTSHSCDVNFVWVGMCEVAPLGVGGRTGIYTVVPMSALEEFERRGIRSVLLFIRTPGASHLHEISVQGLIAKAREISM